MITTQEHKEIFEIVDSFGGFKKQELRKRIISLLRGHEVKLKNEIKKQIDKI